mmetsp:Transcript_57706/g.137291  ORF Transcript_57706/g.137291 Transcript_57706/m.137291 type:complete len:581 (+) Transcript_57706:82-1824(+)
MESDTREGHDSHQAAQERPSHVFTEIEKLREVDMIDAVKDEAEIEAAKFNDSIFGRIATDKRFEISTMVVISLNSLLIGYDADYTARYHRPEGLYDADQPKQFVVLELFFALYFSAELFIRFLAFKRKCTCFYDKWFVFDGLLVLMMVVETFIIETVIISMTGSGSPVSGANVLRLLRLLRVTRMSRLMRSFPALMVIIKGLAASVRSVFWTGFIMVLMTYTWAILFTSQFHQGRDSDEDILCCTDPDCADEQGLELFFDIDQNEPKTVNDCVVQAFFGSIGKSMASLLIMGSVLDDVTACSDSIRRSSSPHFLGFFILYIILASFTMLNMLTGILCSVVNATAEGEKIKSSSDRLRQAIRTIVLQLDRNEDGEISRSEFEKLQKDKRVMESLRALDIDSKEIEQYTEFFFPPRLDGLEATVSVNDMTEAMLRTRPGSTVSALDLAAMKHGFVRNYLEAQAVISRCSDAIAKMGRPKGKTSEYPPGAWRATVEPNAVVAWPGRGGSLESVDASPSNADVSGPGVSIDAVLQLERLPSEDIILELERRSASGDAAHSKPLSLRDAALLRALAAVEEEEAAA